MRVTAQSMGRNSYLSYKIASRGNSNAGLSAINSALSSLASSTTASGSNDMFSLAAQQSSLKANNRVLRSYYKGLASGKFTGSIPAAQNNASSQASLKALRSEASDLSAKAVALSSKGSKSVFKTDSSGEYDRQAIADAVKGFVDSYNSTRDAVVKTTDSRSIQTAVNMINGTKANESMLNKVGITIGSNNNLSLDTEKLKSADISDISSLFSGTGSYAYEVAKQASQISSYATAATSGSSLPGYAGSKGSIIDTFA